MGYMRHKNGNDKALFPQAKTTTTTTIKSKQITTLIKPKTVISSLTKIDWRNTAMVGPIKGQENSG
jgi:hypothetical protein